MPRTILGSTRSAADRVIGIRRHGPGGHRLPDRVTGPRDPRSASGAPSQLRYPQGRWPLHHLPRVVG
jgi:hypothetical protein